MIKYLYHCILDWRYAKKFRKEDFYSDMRKYYFDMSSAESEFAFGIKRQMMFKD